MHKWLLNSYNFHATNTSVIMKTNQRIWVLSNNIYVGQMILFLKSTHIDIWKKKFFSEPLNDENVIRESHLHKFLIFLK